MTDHVRTLTVLLDDEYRNEDAEVIANTIRMIKGVADAELGEPVDIREWAARMTVGAAYRKAINFTKPLIKWRRVNDSKR